MSVEDLGGVLENEVRAYEFPWTHGVFADCLRQAYECWVVCQNDTIVGHSVLSVGANEAHLLNVCIRRDRQSLGLGREMMNFILTRAEQLGVDTVFLEVRPSNVVARRLYGTLGFREIGMRKNYYPAHTGNEDAQVLALQLDY
jgi:ribosomal-protein-alanine N-acetyltransferase